MEEHKYVLLDRETGTAFALAENGVDLICAGLDAEGRPDWSDASLADPRGLSDKQWAWCGRVRDYLRDIADNPFVE